MAITGSEGEGQPNATDLISLQGRRSPLEARPMTYAFYTCDVFTDRRFGGNPLAVLPAAEGLTTDQMQQIAREFNYSETTFVLPPEAGHTRRVRIFTPAREVPFAGHPNIGTACVLAAAGELGDIGTSAEVVFEEGAGLVPITVERQRGGGFWAELQAPQPLTLGPTVPAAAIAAALGLPAEAVVTDHHPPRVASVGLPFIMAEVRNRAVLAQARIHLDAFAEVPVTDMKPDIHLYTRSADSFDIRARMFAPLDGVPEDPATGSANCALAGLLGHLEEPLSGTFAWRIAQGVEMGRPSRLHARCEKRDGAVVATWIGGGCVIVSEGCLYLE